MSTFGISHKYELIRVQENIDYELNSCIEGKKSKTTLQEESVGGKEENTCVSVVREGIRIYFLAALLFPGVIRLPNQ